MSVHQVEQYYIHVDLTNCTDENREEIIFLLIESDCQDFHFTGTDLTVDEFDSGADAGIIDEMINGILNNN